MRVRLNQPNITQIIWILWLYADGCLEPCDACIAARFAELEHQQYTYKNGKIYIEKRIVVTDESTSNGMKMMNGYGSDTPPSNHSNGVKNEFGANGNGLLASMGETVGAHVFG